MLSPFTVLCSIQTNGLISTLVHEMRAKGTVLHKTLSCVPQACGTINGGCFIVSQLKKMGIKKKSLAIYFRSPKDLLVNSGSPFCSMLLELKRILHAQNVIQILFPPKCRSLKQHQHQLLLHRPRHLLLLPFSVHFLLIFPISPSEWYQKWKNGKVYYNIGWTAGVIQRDTLIIKMWWWGRGKDFQQNLNFKKALWHFSYLYLLIKTLLHISIGLLLIKANSWCYDSERKQKYSQSMLHAAHSLQEQVNCA